MARAEKAKVEVPVPGGFEDFVKAAQLGGQMSDFDAAHSACEFLITRAASMAVYSSDCELFNLDQEDR